MGSVQAHDRAGSMTIREPARRRGCDAKAVHGDIHALLNTGILQKTENGRIVFPFLPSPHQGGRSNMGALRIDTI